jgi:hypothetical protein
MSKSQGPKPIGKARAAAIRAEIEELAKGEQSGEKKKPSPSSPRDFIQQWMAEHDKETKEK